MSQHKKYHRRGKSKFLLKCHLIFVVKYRHDLLKHESIANHVKDAMLSLQTDEFKIDVMEVDKDHIHLLIDYVPQICITQIVRKLQCLCGRDLILENTCGKKELFGQMDILFVRLEMQAQIQSEGT